MCSKESLPDSQTLDPSHAALGGLFKAAEELQKKFEPTTARLRELSNIVQTASPNSVATEAACIEALALIQSALTSGEQFISRYGHLLEDPDPIALLRKMGVVFEGDKNEEGLEAANEDVVMLLIFGIILPVQMQMYTLAETGNEFTKDLERIRQHEQEGGDLREKEEGDSREKEEGDSQEQGKDSREQEGKNSQEQGGRDSREHGGKDSRQQEGRDPRQQEGRDSRELHQY